MENGHEVRFAYALWGMAWFMIGVYDGAFDEEWKSKFFISILTIALFSLWIGYELSFVEFKSTKQALIYFVFLSTGMNMWNIGFIIYKLMLEERLPCCREIWLAPGIVVSCKVFYTVTIALLIAYLGYGIALNLEDFVELEGSKK